MAEETRPIAIIPSDCFRWQPRVQFIDSFRTREAALNCALEHGYNLIVERSEGSSALFDVVDDPDATCTAGLELELFKTEEVLVDPYTESWTRLMLLSIWNLARRLSPAVSGLYVRQIAPALRRAASRQRWATFQRAVRLAWYRHAHWGVHSLKKRLATAARLYCSQIARHCRRAASRCWWSGSAVDLRRLLHRHSQGNITDVVKCLTAEASVLYAREIAPFCHSAASWCWWTDRAMALRRQWHRYSQGNIADAARRLTAEALVLYRREVTPRLRSALSRCRQADIQGTCRRAWSITLLAAIRLTDQFAAAVARLYVRQVAPRLRRVALRYQQADLEGTFRRSIVTGAPPSQSNASQLH